MARYIDIDDEVYRVKDYDKDKQLKFGYAYQKKNYVYPYMGEFNDESYRVAGFYTKEDGSHKLIKPLSEKKAKKYSKDRIYKPDKKAIYEILQNEGVNDTDWDIILSESEDVFAPNISEEDNSLQRLIKRALQLKQIDIKNYQGRFRDPGDASNYKRSLIHHPKMSMEKFLKWCEVLDLEYDIILKDKKNAPNAMGEHIKETNY